MNAETMWLVVAGVLGLAVIIFVAYLIISTARSRPDGGKHRAPNKTRPHRDTFRTEEPEPEPLKQAAIIVQSGDAELRAELTSQCIAAGWDAPLWLEVADLSAAGAAARGALQADVDVVCVRGDATVSRGVVGVLAGTEMPVAFLPTTTAVGGQALPAPVTESLVTQAVPTVPESPAASPSPSDPSPTPTTSPTPATSPTTTLTRALTTSLTTALTGQNARVDIGRARLAPAAASPATEADSLAETRGEASIQADPNVQADQRDQRVATDTVDASGEGDEIVFLHSLVFGDIVSHEDPALSTRIVARGLVKGTSFTATVKPDDEEAITRPARSLAFTTTETAATSGRLDAYLHASHSLKGWTGVARAMMRKSSRATPLLVPLQSAAFTVTLDKPTTITVDGVRIDTGHPGESTIAVDPLSLVVRR